jgi:hypothetical protein
MPNIMTDVLFMADHFVMVTTIETDYSPDTRDIEKAAWDRLGAEYGIDWVGMTRQFIKQVSIEVVQEKPEPTVNDIVKSIEEDKGESNE